MKCGACGAEICEDCGRELEQNSLGISACTECDPEEFVDDEELVEEED
jgi:hypothetical protein